MKKTQFIKKIFAMLIILTMLLPNIEVFAVAGGTGTEADPYIINTKEQLKTLAFPTIDHYKLGADIDLANEEWTPIGLSTSYPFKGNLDGDGYKIKNLKITKPTMDNIGLFGATQNATLKNIAIENVDIQGRSYVAALAGTGKTTKIENCSITGTGKITATSHVGGVVGILIQNSTASKLYSTIDVNSEAPVEAYAGGLMGYGNESTLKESYSTSNVTAKGYNVGGIAGASYVFTIENCFSFGTITGSRLVSGLTTNLNNQATNVVTVINCYTASKIVTTNPGNFNAIVGIIKNAYFDTLLADNNKINPDINARLTNSMLKKSTYQNWNFENIWEMDEDSSYPYLKNLAKPKQVLEFKTGEVAGGTGTEADPYIINTKEQLKTLAFPTIDHYKLGADIDLANEEWTPIGLSTSYPFKGNLDGDGYKIKNLKITKPTMDNIGLFGATQNATLKNIAIENVDIQGRSYVAALAGTGKTTKIENCSITGTGKITATSHVGGVVGILIQNSTASKLYSTIDVNSEAPVEAYAGGLMGYGNESTLKESYSTSNVTAKGYNVGGIAGASYVFTIENCFSFGTITGSRLVSGLTTNLNNQATNVVTVINCYTASKIVTTNPGNFNAIVGIIKNAYFDTLLADNNKINPDINARLTNSMLKKSTYQNWNFENIWEMDEDSSYPYLKNLAKPKQVLEFKTGEVAGGTGTEADPYIINTKEQLKTLAFPTIDHYKLGADIDLANEEWTPIGLSTSYPFKGNLDGDGYKIKNLKITKPTMDNIGLFGATQNATLKNIAIENVDIQGRSYVAALAGTGKTTKIENCSITGTGKITATSHVGGVVGILIQNSTASKLYSTIDVNSEAPVEAYAGGLMGYGNESTLKESYSTSNVTAKGYNVGGIAGASYVFTIENCFSFGTITGSRLVSGLTTNLNNQATNVVTVINCYTASKIVTTNPGNFNAIVGIIKNAYFDTLLADNNKINPDINARLTNSMLKKSTYQNWNFENIWEMDEDSSYPYLKNLAKPKQVLEFKTGEVAGGTGTEADPYIINTKEQLKTLAFPTIDHYKLGADIDLANEEWTPIGLSTSYPFKGNLDGDGYKIKNLKITKPTMDNIGLFGATQNATLKNIAIENVDIQGRSYVAALAGTGKTTKIENCSITGTGKITATSHVGGVVGILIQNSTASKLYSTIDVNSEAPVEAYAGGLMGYGNESTLKESYSTSNVTAKGYNVGGIAGASYVFTIENCFSFGTITGSRLVSGLTTNLNNQATNVVTVINCYTASKIVTTNPGNFNAIVGIIKNAYFDTLLADNNKINPDINARLTNSMLKKSTYQNWNFENIWEMDEDSSYPYLKNLAKPKQVLEFKTGEVAGGTGTEADPYIINTKEQLKTLAFPTIDHYKLGADIDLANEEWTPIGLSTSYPFKGNLDGDGYKIKNLKITKPTMDNIGLFGATQNATLKNIAIENVDIQGRSYVAALAGTGKTTKIENCSITGTGKITATSHVGGVVGILIQNSTASKLYSTIDVNSEAPVEAYAGGLMGYGNESTLKESYSTSNVTAKGYNVGGIAGASYVFTIENCFSFGTITGSRLVSGLTTNLNNQATNVVTVINCYTASKIVTTNPGNFNAIVGIIKNAYFDTLLADNNKINPDINARLTNSMLKKSTYQNWNFENIWEMDEDSSYPYLKNLAKPKQVLEFKTGEVAGGTGTEADPYIINTKEQLKTLAFPTIDHYKLGADIDLANEEWTPIGLSTSYPFKGNLDGDGYKIKNLKITKPTMDNIGLFGATQNATLKNIAIENVDIQGRSYVAALAGTGKTTKIENCSITGTGKITATSHVGGVVGILIQNSTASKLYSTIDVNSEAPVEAYAGGLMGYGNESTLKESYSTSNVTAKGYNVGGIAGASYVFTIENCFSFGTITGSRLVSGLTTNLNNQATNVVTVINCYTASKIVTTNPGNFNAIVGIIKNAYFDTLLADNNKINPDINARLTNSMLKKSTYQNWNFENIWEMDEDSSYPYLKNLAKPKQVLEFKTGEVAGGTGTEADPYIINTKEQLKTLAFPTIDHYKLGADIDLANEEWTPIGLSTSYPFKGNLDGDGYKIKNLKITKPTMDNIGLFGATQNATLKNIAIENVDIQGRSYVAALAGTGKTTKIENCSITGTGKITATSHVGGVVGILIQNSTASKLYSTIDVNSEAPVEAYAGGLMGYGNESTLKESYSTSNVTAKGYNVGGIAGASYVFTIENCFSFGTITGSRLVSGLTTNLNNQATNVVTVINCYTASKIVTTNPGNFNAIVGIIKNAYFDTLLADNNKINPDINARLTNSMLKKSTYQNWNFENIWEMDEDSSYPYLKNLAKPKQVLEFKTGEVAGGTGTEADPYIINTKEQLKTLAFPTIDHYKLGADIDLANEEWTPIGLSTSYPFKGNLDGDGYKIKNLKITKPTMDNIGLFGATQNATLKNIAIENVDIQGRSYVAALAGTGKTTKIENCSITGTGKITATSHVGGVVGILIQNSTASKLYSTIDVNSEAPVEAYAGGLMGYGNESTLKESYSTSNVTAKGYNVGGIAGASYVFTIENCFSFGTITGSRLVSGLTTNLNNQATNVVTVINCYTASKIVTTNPGNFNAIVGIIKNAYFDTLLADNNKINPDINARLTNSMLKKSTYQNWNFENIWEMDEDSSYPYLKNLAKPKQVLEFKTGEVAGGTGTEADPYIINTKEQLKTLAFPTIDHYKLGADIDLANEEWTPIGLSTSYPFKGNLDGDGYKIKNLKITKPTMDNIGLFGATQNATLKNIAIENVDIQGRSYVAALAGTGKTTKIENCSITGTGKITATSHVGGVVGILIQNSTASKLYSTIDVNSEAPVEAYAGGLMGYGNESTLKESYSTSNVTAKGYNVGGIAGASYVFTIENCFSFGTITGSRLVSGLTTNLNNQATNVVTVINCYTASKIVTTNPGNFNAIVGIIKNAYFDTLLADNNKINPDINARTSEQLLDINNYIGWDFNNIWEFDGISYPYLKNLDSPFKTQLPAPKDIKIIETNNSITIDWQAVDDATEYEITYNNTIYKTTELTYTIKELLPNSTYSIKIMAKNNEITGRRSPEITGYTLLADIQNLAIEENLSTKITLKWDAVVNATSYEIDFDGVITKIADLQKTFIDLNSNTKYNFKIRAINENTKSIWSEISATTGKPAFNPPTDIVISNIKTDKININWQSIDGATLYKIYLNDVTYETINNNITIDKLISNTKYSIKIQALSDDLTGLVSDTQNVFTLLDTPQNVQVDEVLTKSLKLKWDEVSGATSYEINVSGQVYEAVTNLITIENLQPQTNYTITVKAKNANTISEISEGITAKTSITSLVAPQNIIISEITDKAAKITWNATANATEYIIKLGDKTFTATKPEYELTSLTENTQYSVTIAAKNTHTQSAASPATLFTTLIKPLTKPIGLAAKNIKDNSIELTWNVAPGATSYTVKIGEIEHNTDTNSITINNLNQNTQYKISVQAKNDKTASLWSDEITAKTSITSLAVPQNIIISEITDKAAKITWNATANATEYIIKLGDKTFTATKPEYELTSLTENTQYSVTIAAKNTHTQSAASPATLFTTKYSPLLAPKNVISSTTDVTITLNWDTVADAVSYEVICNEKTYNTLTNTILIPNLTQETEYNIKIKAKNALKDGISTDSIKIKTLKSIDRTMSEITAQAVLNKEYFIALTVNNIETFNNKKFILTYDATKISIEDMAAHFKKQATATGAISGTDIEILSNKPGEITFKINRQIPAGKKYTGALTFVRFTAKIAGEIKIQLSMQ